MDGPHYAQTALMWAARSGANKVVKERWSYRPTQAHAHLLSPSHKAQHKRTRRSLAPTSTEPQASTPYVRTAFVDILVASREMKSALQSSHPSLGAHRCGRTCAPLPRSLARCEFPSKERRPAVWLPTFATPREHVLRLPMHIIIQVLATDKNGRTAVDYAEVKGKTETVKLLKL